MFYQVKIYDAKGKVKRVISSKEISRKYWEKFFGSHQNRVQLKLGRQTPTSRDLDENRDNFEDDYSLN